MADAPISTTVPETVTVDTGADSEQLGDLNKAFSDFWGEQDTGTPAPKEEPPPAPEAPDVPEIPKEKPPATEPTKEAAPVERVDIDKIELTGEHTPTEEHKGQFNKVKDLWKADQRRLEEAQRQLLQTQNELVQARQNAWTPETKADYEHAVQIRRRFDFMSDPQFLQQYHQPVRAQFERILDEAVQVLPDRQASIAWANHIKQNYGPDSVNREWWLNSVVAKVPNELDRTSLINRVSKLLELQQDRDSEITRRTNDKSSYENWNNERTQAMAQNVQNELMAEIGVQEKRIQEVMPVDVSTAKTADERQAMEAHNERFKNLNNFFVSQVQDISKNGPRGWVRVAIEATRAMIMNEQIINLEKELKEVKSERDKFKNDLDKINGARRKLTQTTPATTTSEAKKNGQGLSIKDLSDPRKGMNAFFDELDRNT